MDRLEINTNIFANNGAIGRRDYLVNLIYLNIASTFFMLPILNWIVTHIHCANEILNINQVILKAPSFSLLSLMSAFAINILIGISNIKRRLNDILGYENQILKYIFSTIFIITTISICLPLFFMATISTIQFFIGLFLLFKKGKISSQKGYELEKQFNFGAFFGTIFWGLINGVHQPLWLIILFFTPFCPHFIMLCGLKGNEWLIKKQNVKIEEIEIDAFNSNQKKQAVALFIFANIIMPTAIAAFSISKLTNFLTNYANGKFKTDNQKYELILKKIVKTAIAHYFVSYQIYGNKNVFYVKDEVWNKLTFEEKAKVMKLASQVAVEIRERNAANPNIKTNEFSELSKTELYSSDGKQLIGKFEIDNKAILGDNINYIQTIMNGYKFQSITK